MTISAPALLFRLGRFLFQEFANPAAARGDMLRGAAVLSWIVRFESA
jgi:hypothetical protein